MKTEKQSGVFVYILPIAVMAFNILIILFPKEIISAARNGIGLWFNNVLPSLLPFVIGTNLLIGLGVVSFFGTLLEPLMLKLFNVPGCGVFAWVLGLTSGYPMGAKITADLRLKNELTREEAQRLLSFSNNSGPLFIIGSVATGMFGNAMAGYFMLLIHFLGSFTTGIIFRRYKHTKAYIHKKPDRHIVRKSLYNLKAARIKDGRSFGTLLFESVRDSMETMLVIGGFIIIFSVLTEALRITNILDMLAGLASLFGGMAGIKENIYDGLFIGIIEMTNGCKILSDNPSAAKIITAAGIISWGGLSIHAQTISFLQKTDIRVDVYLLSKLIHFVITVVYGILLYPLMRFDMTGKEDVTAMVFGDNIFYSLAVSGRQFLIVVSLIALCGFLINMFRFRKRNL